MNIHSPEIYTKNEEHTPYSDTWLSSIIFVDSHTAVPEVTDMESGLRCVDVYQDIQNTQEASAIIMACEMVGVGRNAIAFAPFDNSEILIRVEIINPAGYEWTMNLLQTLYENCDSLNKQRIQILIEKVSTIGEEKYKKRLKSARQSFRKRIAAHNSQYRRDPRTCMPINSYYAFNGQPFAQRIKYLKGTSLREIDPNAKPSPDHMLILGDVNPANVIMCIENSQFETQVIDICKFVPSDQPLDLDHKQDSE